MKATMTKAKMKRRKKAKSSATTRVKSWVARAISIAVILSFAPAAPGDVAGRGSLGDRHAGALLESVIEHYRNGEFEPAWEAYRAFFEHPSNHNVDIEAFSRCFFRQECPSVGALGHILGKSEAEGGNFRTFCPNWEGADRGKLSADEIAQVRREIEAFRYTALAGTCAEWVKRNAAMLDLRPANRRLGPQVVPLAESSSKESRPIIEVEILGKRVTGFVDTGATFLFLNRGWADTIPKALDPIQDMRVNFVYRNGVATLARMSDIQLGNEIFLRPIVLIGQLYGSESGEKVSIEYDNVIGMSLLLQYEKVCFHWEGRKLYLGELGPCAGGITPYRNWLTGSQGIAVEARMSSNARYLAKIDTGSHTTYCSQWTKEREADSEMFSFGSHFALRGKCNYDPDIRFETSQLGEKSPNKHMLLGMDVLGKSAAFGWQLNPLKVYFVPKSPDSD